MLDHEGDLVLHENVSGGIPTNLEALLSNLVDDIPDDCDPNLMCGPANTCCDGLLYPTTCCSENCDEPIDLGCGEAVTCCDGLLYPTTCCSENCDEPIGECGECTDGEMNNDNPCNPMECYDGQWIEIIIDCAEQMGVPCEGGVYVEPPAGVCCSACVQYGDTNGDGSVDVVDIVMVVNLILTPSYLASYSAVADINGDDSVDVVDIVMLVGMILEGG